MLHLNSHAASSGYGLIESDYSGRLALFVASLPLFWPLMTMWLDFKGHELAMRDTLRLYPQFQTFRLECFL